MRILVLDEMKALKEALPYWVYACMHTHTHTHTWISLPVHSQRTACQMKFFPSSPHVCVQPALLQSCPTLCDSGDCSLSGCSVHGILQARILEWVAMPSSSESFDPGMEPTSPTSPALAGGFFTTSPTWDAQTHCTFTPIPLRMFLLDKDILGEITDTFFLLRSLLYCPLSSCC